MLLKEETDNKKEDLAKVFEQVRINIDLNSDLLFDHIGKTFCQVDMSSVSSDNNKRKDNNMNGELWQSSICLS